MKKLLLGTAAIFAMTAANGAQAQDYNEYGFDVSPYIGAYGGYGWVYDGNDANDFDYGLYAGVSADGLLDATINRVGLGLSGRLEGHYGWSSMDEDGIEKNHEWGVSFKPGMSFIDAYMPIAAEPYAILGYRNTEFETAAGDDNYHGFELGLGTEVLAYDMATVRLEYTHVFYGSENGFDPDEDNIRLGVGYNF
jgi:opacity protein-like surface antigen